MTKNEKIHFHKKWIVTRFKLIRDLIMLGSSGAFGWFFWGLWVLNLQMFLICGPLGLNKEGRIYFTRAPGGDHFGEEGLCLSG